MFSPKAEAWKQEPIAYETEVLEHIRLPIPESHYLADARNEACQL